MQKYQLPSNSSNYCMLGTLTAKHCDSVYTGVFHEEEKPIKRAVVATQLQILLLTVLLLLLVPKKF